MALGAVIDKAGFQRGLDAGDHALCRYCLFAPLPTVSISRSISFAIDTATRSSSACVALNNMRFILAVLRGTRRRGWRHSGRQRRTISTASRQQSGAAPDSKTGLNRQSALTASRQWRRQSGLGKNGRTGRSVFDTPGRGATEAKSFAKSGTAMGSADSCMFLRATGKGLFLFMPQARLQVSNARPGIRLFKGRAWNHVGSGHRVGSNFCMVFWRA